MPFATAPPRMPSSARHPGPPSAVSVPLARAAAFLGPARGAFAALVLLFVLASLVEPVFLKSANLTRSVLQASSFSGIVALGMTFVILAGGIDLSVGSLFALSGVTAVLAGNALAARGAAPGAAFAVACAAAVAAGLAGGAVNGALVAAGRIPPFIATLGTYSIYRSLALYFANSSRVAPDPAVAPLFANLSDFSALGLPAAVLAFLVLAILFDLWLSLTPFGRHVLATGAGERVALLSGIRTNRVRFATYLIAGFCAGAAAVPMIGRLNGIESSNAGLFYELDAIAAVVIGGASMAGGRGSLRGTLFGVLILGIVTDLLQLRHLNPSLKDAVKGLVIIAAVLVQGGALSHLFLPPNRNKGTTA